jgi:hypothetical protein
MARPRLVATVGLVAALLLPAPALAASGRLLVPGASATTSSPDAELAFDLGPAWSQVRGELAGTPMRGTYERAHRPPGVQRCTVTVHVAALASRRGPVVRRGTVRSAAPSRWLPPTRILRDGRRGATRWWLARVDAFGAEAREPAGAAAVRIPRGLAPRGRPWAVVAARLWFTTEDRPAAREGCSSFAYLDQRETLRDALASARVVPRAGVSG